MQKIGLFVILVVILFSACSKGKAPEEHYFGAIKVTYLNLPDAGKADIFLGTEKLGQIDPEAADNLDFMFPAGKSGVLKIYKAGTTSLIADTNIAIAANKTQQFRVGYSESLQIKGFISDVNVPADSIRIQFIYNVRKPFNPYPEVDVHLYPLFMEDAGIVIKGLKLNDANPKVWTFPKLGEGDNPPGYFFKLKDVKTGEFIKQTADGGDMFPLIAGTPDYYGHYLFVNINDDQGEETENYITATITVL